MEIPLQICDKNHICVDNTIAFLITQRFNTRKKEIRWIKEIEIRNKVTIVITHSNTKISKRGRNNKVIFSCDEGGKYKETDSRTQSVTKNAVVHSK